MQSRDAREEQIVEASRMPCSKCTSNTEVYMSREPSAGAYVRFGILRPDLVARQRHNSLVKSTW
jgi:hypothetical protein